MKKIEFICTYGSIFDSDKPIPAKNIIPEWYKKIKPYQEPEQRVFLNSGAEVGNGPGFHYNYQTGFVDNETIKKCVPVLDSITSGYIIRTYCDILVEDANDGTLFFSWAKSPGSFEVITFHNPLQVTGHPDVLGSQIPKFKNIWSVKTPKGYSCLFVSPLHGDTPIKIFPGIVDTDTHHAAVEFPFVLKDLNFRGLIPKGTPVAQIIPIKRDNWESSYYEGSDTNIVKHVKSMFVDGYRKLYWSKKHYN
jgi:hypothetical protein